MTKSRDVLELNMPTLDEKDKTFKVFKRDSSDYIIESHCLRKWETIKQLIF